VRVVSSLNRGMGALRQTMARRGVGFVIVLTTLVVFAGAAGMYARTRRTVSAVSPPPSRICRGPIPSAATGITNRTPTEAAPPRKRFVQLTTRGDSEKGEREIDRIGQFLEQQREHLPTVTARPPGLPRAS
jgi:hypothetical protein